MTTTTPPPVQQPPLQPPSPRHRHRGWWIAAIAGGAALAVGIGIGIGATVTSNHTTASKQRVSTSQPAKPKASASHPASTPASAAVKAANGRRLIHWLASGTTDMTGVESAVTGPAMRAYVDYIATFTEADAQAGYPDAVQQVTAIPGGYQLCGPAPGDGATTCDTFTAFTHDPATGRVTNMAVDGKVVSARIATGPANTGSHLRISHVVGHRLGSEVYVNFRVRNISSEAITGFRAFLVYFNPAGGGQFTSDDNSSVIPDTLQPGESAVVSAAFATRTPTGRISVRSNDGYMAVLAATDLTRPAH